MTRIIVLLIFCSFSLKAETPPRSYRKEVLEKLPKEFASLSKETSLTEILRRFSHKKIKRDENTVFVNYFTEDNDVSLGIENNRFKYAFIKIPKSLERSFEGIYPKIQKGYSTKEKNSPHPHLSGRYLTLDSSRDGLQIDFVKNDSMSVNSILLWDPKDSRP